MNGRGEERYLFPRKGSSISGRRFRERQKAEGQYVHASTAREDSRAHVKTSPTTPSPITIARNSNIDTANIVQKGNNVQRISRPTSRQRVKNNDWVKTQVVSELSPEEVAMRDALKSKAVIEESIRSQNITTLIDDPKSDDQATGTQDFRWRPTRVQSAHDFTDKAPSALDHDESAESKTEHLPPHVINKHAASPVFQQAATRTLALDDHIARSRAQDNRPQERDWHCPECGHLNYGQTKKCKKCEGGARVMREEQAIDEEMRLAKGWKHVRRPPPTKLQLVQPAHSSETSGSRDLKPMGRAKDIELERTIRIEQTKLGQYVGLKAGHPELDLMSTESPKGPFRAERNKSPPVMSDPGSLLKEDPARLSGSGEGTPTEASNRVTLNHNQDHTSRRKSPRVKDDWKRWEPPENATNAYSSQPDLKLFEQMPEKIVAYRPMSVTTDQPPQLFRTVGSQAQRDIQSEREPSLSRGTKLAKESKIVASPYISQGNRDLSRRSNKQYVSKADREEMLDDDEDALANRRMERKEQRKKAKAVQKAAAPPTPVYLPEYISISNLAAVLKVRVESFSHKMKDLGFEAMNNDHILDAETAGLIAAEFNFEPIIDRGEDRDLHPLPLAEQRSLLPARPPVVTIMGHVDHGKTTLLDYLRKSSVAASEHGGITQHIGAFSVSMPGGRLVTFLDTPGHEAFLSMRQRGANVTDIVILVVAADDSVKPQTIEAIKHAQVAKVPMIVAINKIDKEDSNAEKVKQDLARYGVEIEDYGGDTQVVLVSGKTGQGMKELEDAAVALADILDMRAETDGQAEGWVLEATTNRSGRVATVLVRRGTLRPGDVIIAGRSWARVRSLRNEAGTTVQSAGPGTPIQIDGWREQPAAGDEVIQAPDEQKAKSVIDYRLESSERARLAADMEAVNEARNLEQEKRDQLESAAKLAAANPDGPAVASTQELVPTVASTPNFQEVFFIIKGDVSGSVEAVHDSVSALGNGEVRPHILRSGVGPVTEFDIDHAAVAKGHIINFNTNVDGAMQRMAEVKDVKILNHSIIYRLTDDVKKTLSERLPSITTQKVLGEAEIGQIFEINTKGRIKIPIAGCRIRNGIVGRTSKIRVLREKEIIYDGKFRQRAKYYCSC